MVGGFQWQAMHCFWRASLFALAHQHGAERKKDVETWILSKPLNLMLPHLTGTGSLERHRWLFQQWFFIFLHTKANWLMLLTLQAWLSKLWSWKSHFKAYVPLILRHRPIIKAISAWFIPVSKGFVANRLSCSQLFGMQTHTITHRTVSVLLSGLYSFAALIQLESFSLSFPCLWGKMCNCHIATCY